MDGVAAALRRSGEFDEHRHAYVTLARTTAAALDRLEQDPDRSEHVLGTVARVHAHCLDSLRPADALAGADPFDDLLTALRDTPAT